MPVSGYVYLVIGSGSKLAIEHFLFCTVELTQVSNKIEYPVFCELRITQLCQVNVQSLLFDNRIIILL